ncbi:hypothetical protein KIF59_16660 [Enterobacter cloacae subsp. cloacae]|nr:hypothetical protein [Enterobacter cloacae subsp. cloacae]
MSASLGLSVQRAGELNLSMVRGGARRDYHADTSGSILVHTQGCDAWPNSSAAPLRWWTCRTPGHWLSITSLAHNQCQRRAAGELNAMASEPHYGR